MAYSAIVLDKDSRKAILDVIAIPNGWEFIAHHMNVSFGKIPRSDHQMAEHRIPWRLVATHFGAIDHKVIAIKISMVEGGWLSNNETPHITVAVNREAGGKPFMSNEITEWTKLQERLGLNGEMEICD